jgi:RNA polymerase sigma-70 factor (ECF subfamily)
MTLEQLGAATNTESPGTLSPPATLGRRMIDAGSSDSELVTRARAGETGAFEALMRRHNPRVYRIVRSVVRNEAEVEDVMQDAYVNAFTHLSSLQTSLSFSTWMRKIAFHEALRRIRRAKGSPFSEVDMELVDPVSSQPTPEAAAGSTQLKAALELAIDALPDGFREVFMLRAVEGCSVAETAEVLGLHEETVKTRQFRARARLQETLAAWTDRGAPESFAFHAQRCDRVVAAVLKRLLDAAEEPST